MSYIDTFDHELVGFFAGLPLYHPLETVTGAGGDEFGCTPLQLVLGGGSGESPAIVLTKPDAAVATGGFETLSTNLCSRKEAEISSLVNGTSFAVSCSYNQPESYTRPLLAVITALVRNP